MPAYNPDMSLITECSELSLVDEHSFASTSLDPVSNTLEGSSKSADGKAALAAYPRLSNNAPQQTSDPELWSAPWTENDGLSVRSGLSRATHKVVQDGESVFSTNLPSIDDAHPPCFAIDLARDDSAHDSILENFLDDVRDGPWETASVCRGQEVYTDSKRNGILLGIKHSFSKSVLNLQQATALLNTSNVGIGRSLGRSAAAVAGRMLRLKNGPGSSTAIDTGYCADESHTSSDGDSEGSDNTTGAARPRLSLPIFDRFSALDHTDSDSCRDGP